ncbi:MAG: HPr(Ser) kinase/phosphatase [Xanthomonadales bacterium]|jgi:HPr kinase/phosphorylase|nr:HPr(Ser) kinase/phosphatase [Xanthomonadales bacterium]
MSEGLSARLLFDELRERLTLRWIAGQRGERRELDAADDIQQRPALVGYLNTIHPNKVQIIGTEELAHLDALPAEQRWETLTKIMAAQPLALVVSQSQRIPTDLRDAANQHDCPLWVSPNTSHELLTYLQYHLARAAARRETMHGVFMEVYSIGVLITGASGSGKSELALELITRGHRLVADDATEFTQIAPDVLDGTCPELLQDLLEVRGLGILDIREMFGDTSVKRNKYLRLIVHLERHDPQLEAKSTDRLYGDVGQRRILDIDIPQITLPVAPGRNLAVLVEAAVRSHILKSKGVDPAQTFIDRQAHQMRRQSPWQTAK